MNQLNQQLASFRYHGQLFTFVVNDASDVIQRHYLLGEFYEQRELEAIQLCIPQQAVVIDVGTNIGNHAIYFDRVMGCSQVICFEPNPAAIDMLRENVGMNHATAVDLSHIGVGVGRDSGHAKILLPQPHNIGAARLAASDDAQGTIPVEALDNIIAGLTDINLIKIDAEGMELDVLAGAARIISGYRPVLLVEVAYEHRRAFSEWCDLSNYRVEQTFQRYQGVFNYLCIAKF